MQVQGFSVPSSPRVALASRTHHRRHRSSWTQAHVRRLFWRAGFGATPREARHWARQGREATLRWILDGDRGPVLRGRKPTVAGRPLDPTNEWGHDGLWWLDRMVRTRRPLVEKMTLFWHDHFATSDEYTPLMLAQNAMLRAHALGSFPALLEAVTQDPAMLLFLSLAGSDPDEPNENYARELMELFTLGGGYSEQDVRQAARALTGFQADWRGDGPPRLFYDSGNHADGAKTIFGQSGNFDWHDVVRLVCGHPRHAPFLVEKLWSFFVGTPPSRRTKAELVRIYRASNLEIKPLVRVILAHPALYAGLDRPDMVKAPIVYVAGALRATGDHVHTDVWTWLTSSMGQFLFHPPSVAGWEWGTAWLSSNSVKVRSDAVNYLTEKGPLGVRDKSTPVGLTPKQALRRAWRACGEPWASPQTMHALHDLAKKLLTGPEARHHQDAHTRADMCQRALRQLLIAGPDGQVH